MSKKRGQREGSIYQRSDGRWTAAFSVPSHSGKRRRKCVYGQTRREVQDKLVKLLRDQQQGLPALDERGTLGDYLDRWLADSAKLAVKPRTHQRYGEIIRVHLQPMLGKVPLARLSPDHLQNLYRTKLDEGLSASTVVHIHRVAHVALKAALRRGLVARNVADAVSPPRIARHEPVVLSPGQVGTLLKIAKGDSLEALYVMAVTTGMREGELLALKWADLDLQACTARVQRTLVRLKGQGPVEGTPKSAKGRRQVPLSAGAVEALRRHRAVQAETRLAAGAEWHETGLVFCNAVGRPLDPSNLLRRHFRPLLERAELPAVRFHDLRHAAATLMLASGVHPKAVQEILGHSQISVTLDTYSHVLPSLKQGAADAVEAAVQAAQAAS